MADDPLPIHAWRDAVASKFGPSPTTRLVLLALALSMDNRTLIAWPSVRTLAERTGLNKETVAVHLGLAAKSGWLSVAGIKASGKGWKRHEYVGQYPEGVRPIQTPQGVRPDRTAGGKVSGSTEMVSGLTGDGVRPSRTELSKNSSLNKMGDFKFWEKQAAKHGIHRQPNERSWDYKQRVKALITRAD